MTYFPTQAFCWKDRRRSFVMPAPMKILPVLLGLVSLLPLHAQEKPEIPASAHRIVFLGDSITYAGQYTADVEAYVTTHQPGREIDWINVGLPSETVSGLSEPGHAGGQFPRPDLHERLDRVLVQTKPDLVFACYGMNDGIYLPFDETRFKAYQDGIQWLRDRVTAAHAKLILLTPPFFDGEKVHNPAYSTTLDRYAAWLLDQRKVGWAVIDIHGPMTDYITERRKKEPAFVYGGDGIHPNDLGHWIMAKAILQGLGARDLDTIGSAAEMAALKPQGVRVLDLVRRREELLRDSWLHEIGHKRPGMNDKAPAVKDAAVTASQMAKEIKEIQSPGYKPPVRVACVGDSITQGAGAAPGKSYPSQLQDLLGATWEVKNFGVSGRTLLKQGDYPYWKEKAYEQAKECQPAMVVIMLGTNDTKPQNWAHKDDFHADYLELIKSFQALASKPRVFLCRPCPVPEPGNFGINETNLKVEIPIIDQLAKETGSAIIDIHAALENKPALLPDHVHPNNEGAAVMARTIAAALKAR